MAVPHLVLDGRLNFLLTLLEVRLPELFALASVVLQANHPSYERVFIAPHAEWFSRLCRVDAEAS